MPALPIDYLNGQTSTPSDLRTAEWDRVPLWIRERSFFMAGVEDAEILDRFRKETEAIARGEASESEARLRLRDFLAERGYQPEPGQEGTIKDLRSVKRQNVALRTNVEMARGWAQWQAQNSPGALAAFPARRYHRGRQVQVPRDWRARWKRALAATAAEGATDGDAPDLIALHNHPLWSDAEFNRFGTPFTPFDFGSGMTTSPESRRRAKELGLLPDPSDKSEAADFQRSLLRPQHRGMNETLEATPAVESEELRKALGDRLAGFARWESRVEESRVEPVGGDSSLDAGGARTSTLDDQAPRLIFTDPNGTRPGTIADIAATIAAPLPIDPATGERFPSLQAEALEAFAANPEEFARKTDRDVWHDFARLTARIAPTEEARRGWLSRLVEESRDLAPPAWIDQIAATLLDLPEWAEALQLTNRTERFAGMLGVIARLMF